MLLRNNLEIPKIVQILFQILVSYLDGASSLSLSHNDHFKHSFLLQFDYIFQFLILP